MVSSGALSLRLGRGAPAGHQRSAGRHGHDHADRGKDARDQGHGAEVIPTGNGAEDQHRPDQASEHLLVFPVPRVPVVSPATMGIAGLIHLLTLTWHGERESR